jgi:hypothetical protein
MASSEVPVEVPNVDMDSDAAVDLPSIAMYLKNTPGKGRGVFIDRDVAYNTLLHISPLLLFPADETPTGCALVSAADACPERRVLAHYTYTFNSKCQAIALGLGSMFNHSKHNNVGFIIDKKNLLIRYSSITSISKGTELCINYGNHLWFDDSGSVCDDSSSEEGDDPFGRMEL